MMQGDSYNFGILIRNNAGNPVTPEDVKDVEITIGQLRKTYLNTELAYSDGMWYFPVSQEESVCLRPAAQKAQVRIAWANGAVEGKPIYGIRVEESTSKEVL